MSITKSNSFSRPNNQIDGTQLAELDAAYSEVFEIFPRWKSLLVESNCNLLKEIYQSLADSTKNDLNLSEEEVRAIVECFISQIFVGKLYDALPGPHEIFVYFKYRTDRNASKLLASNRFCDLLSVFVQELEQHIEMTHHDDDVAVPFAFAAIFTQYIPRLRDILWSIREAKKNYEETYNFNHLFGVQNLGESVVSQIYRTDYSSLVKFLQLVLVASAFDDAIGKSRTSKQIINILADDFEHLTTEQKEYVDLSDFWFDGADRLASMSHDIRSNWNLMLRKLNQRFDRKFKFTCMSPQEMYAVRRRIEQSLGSRNLTFKDLEVSLPFIVGGLNKIRDLIDGATNEDLKLFSASYHARLIPMFRFSRYQTYNSIASFDECQTCDVTLTVYKVSRFSDEYRLELYDGFTVYEEPLPYGSSKEVPSYFDSCNKPRVWYGHNTKTVVFLAPEDVVDANKKFAEAREHFAKSLFDFYVDYNETIDFNSLGWIAKLASHPTLVRCFRSFLESNSPSHPEYYKYLAVFKSLDSLSGEIEDALTK